MKYFATISALVSIIPGILSLTINTPTGVVQCQPQMLTWTDGTTPYYLTVIPGGQPAAAPIKSFPTQNGNSMTWMVDIAGGTPVTLALKDGTGNTAYSDTFTIQQNSDSSCMSQAPAAPAAQAAAVATDATTAAASTSSGTAPQPAVTSSRPVIASAGTATVRATTATIQSNQQTMARPTVTTAAAAGPTPSASTTSGTQTRFTVGGSVFAAALSLLGAILL